MSAQLGYVSSEGEVISDDLFGANLLANRGSIYGDGQYDTAINDLGVTSLRYPGGSRAEKSFDINNPDADTAVDQQTGQVDEWIALTDFFSYAHDNGHPVSIVIPTRFNLSDDIDESGNRTPDFSEDDLRAFVRDVASGAYGTPKIHAFEIGNEYWNSGQMNSVEYGQLATKMTEIIDDELDIVARDFPSVLDIQITVQMGFNYGDAKLDTDYEGMAPTEALAAVNAAYGLNLNDDAFYNSGSINWGYINNEIIINEFEKAEMMDEVDGVIAHVYSLGQSNEWSRVFELKMVQDAWMEDYPDLEIHVTEWNLKGVTDQLDRHEDYGLHQSEEILNMMEEFVRVGVDHAHIWPMLQFTDNALNFGFVYEETNVPGAMFRMMADNLPGKTLLDFEPSNERVTEAEFDHISVHGFAGDSELLLYVTPMGSDSVTSTDLDLSGLLVGFDSMELTILGVEAGGKGLGSNATSAVLETVDPASVYDEGLLDVSLDPEEILQIVIKGVIPTDVLAPYVTPPFDPYDEDMADPTIDVPPDMRSLDDPRDEIGHSFEADDASDIGLSLLLAAVPILALLAFAG